MSSLNEMQNLRSYLVEKVNYDVEKAKKVWDFIMDYKWYTLAAYSGSETKVADDINKLATANSNIISSRICLKCTIYNHGIFIYST